MQVQTYFRQDCPSCGRPLRFSIDLLGRETSCPHCRARFFGRDRRTSECVTGAGDHHIPEHPVLLVHSNRDHLSSLTRHFTQIGYNITPVHHPRQALEASTFKPFRVALIDASLPEIDGVELARRLRRRVSDLLVILTIDAEQAHHGRHRGDDLWMILEKPCALVQLASSLEEAIQESLVIGQQRLETQRDPRFQPHFQRVREYDPSYSRG